VSARIAVRLAVLAYVTLLLALPLGTVVWRTFEPGLGAFWAALRTPEAVHALQLTLVTTAIAVPLCAVLGVVTAIALTRHRFPGRAP
jgi:sulfate transport system permease protein